MAAGIRIVPSPAPARRPAGNPRGVPVVHVHKWTPVLHRQHTTAEKVRSATQPSLLRPGE